MGAASHSRIQRVPSRLCPRDTVTCQLANSPIFHWDKSTSGYILSVRQRVVCNLRARTRFSHGKHDLHEDYFYRVHLVYLYYSLQPLPQDVVDHFYRRWDPCFLYYMTVPRGAEGASILFAPLGCTPLSPTHLN